MSYRYHLAVNIIYIVRNMSEKYNYLFNKG